MRLWSLHPSYLDPAGLVACWREALLAQKVLAGETKGYRQHPQLERFKRCADPLIAIGAYLSGLAEEADRRGYRFDKTKIICLGNAPPIVVSTGQLCFESAHLLRKQQQRAPLWAARLANKEATIAHPLFRTVQGEIERWEVTTDRKSPLPSVN